MELNELIKLRDYTELDLLFKLIDIAQKNKKDTERVLKGNKTAGRRVRSSLQDVILIAKIIRDMVQNGKGIKRGPKRVDKLEKAIKLETFRYKRDMGEL